MLALAFSFAATALFAVPSASVTCADGPASCDSAWAPAPAAADEAPREYATPAQVDCPVPPPPPTLLASGECSEPPLNLWYRVSRSAESELPTGRLAPAARRAHPTRTVAGDLPDVGQLSKLTVQPMALPALPALFPTATRRVDDMRAQLLPLRTLAPPDRPPRA